MKTNCEQTQEKILEALGRDGDSLSEATGRDASLREHLKACPACGEFLADLLRIGEGMNALERDSLPSELTRTRILRAAQLQQAKFSERPSIWRFLLSRPLQVAAMFALIIGVGIYSQKWLEEKRPNTLLGPPPPAGDSVPKVPAPPAPLADQPGEAPRPVAQPPSLAKPKAKGGAEAVKRERAVEPPQAPPPISEAGPSGGIGASSAPTKLLQAPAASQPAPEAKKKADPLVEAEFSARSKPDSVMNPAQGGLISAARSKISQGDYPGALQDLLKAQTLGSTPEIERLIELCREKSKPE